MKLIQDDDTLAFNEMYGRFKGPLYTYYCGLISSALAEEMLQETFLKVLNKRDSFRFESKFKTWIWTIAKNTLRDYWRTPEYKLKNAFQSVTDESGEEQFMSNHDPVEEVFLQKVTQRQLHACIDELPVEQKEIVYLHIQSELSNQEIADLLSISLGAVKSQLFRSKEKLLACFKRGGHL